MSNKTIFKRIALVAVSALGAGLLSVAPASAADASADDVDITAATAVINAGACAISSTGQSGTFVNGSRVQLDFDDTGAFYISISGPAVFEASTASDGLAASGSGAVTPTTFTDAGVASGELLFLRLNGLGTVTLTVSTSSTAAAVDSITITSVASCETSTLSLANSNFTIVSLAEADTNSTEGDAWETNFNGVDTTDAEIVDVAGTGYARAALYNVYDNTLASKPIVASTSASCLVAVEASDTTAGVSAAPAASTAVMTGTGEDLTLAVKAATTGAAVNCPVTLTWNGLTVGTKNFVMLGAPATVTVSDVTVGAKSGGYGYFRASVKDALGRALPGVDVSWSSLNATNAANLQVVSAVRTATTASATDASTGAIRGTTPAVTTTNIGNSSVARYTCTAKGGPAKMVVRALVSGITYVSSNAADVYCGGASVDTWTISMDKAQYAPGEIATLTVSAKDADGHLVNSLLALGTLEYSFGGMTAVTAPTSTDLFSSAAGAKTYKFSVGTTEGAFVGTFKITGSTDTAAKTVQYKIAAPSTGAVTNAEVLAAIVKLIASINKQIRALQKSLKR